MEQEKKTEAEKDGGSSLLARAFSSMLVRGIYSGKEAQIDLKLKGSKQEQRRMSHLVNEIAQYSPLGRSILENAAKQGYELSFEMQLGSIGFCSPEDKKIALNPMYSDNALITTLVHEGRHAQQNSHALPEEFGECELKSELMLTRAMEADAQACAAMAALEIRGNTNESGVWESFKSKSPRISEALPEKLTRYQVNYEPFETSPDMMRRAFEGWYKSASTLTDYEQCYIVGVMENATKNDKILPYSKKYTSEQVVNLFCHEPDGSCYLADTPDILNDPRRLSLGAEAIVAADAYFAWRQENKGMAPDTSYKDLPERRDSGLYINGCCVGSLRNRAGKQPEKEKDSVQLMPAAVLHAKGRLSR